MAGDQTYDLEKLVTHEHRDGTVAELFDALTAWMGDYAIQLLSGEEIAKKPFQPVVQKKEYALIRFYYDDPGTNRYGTPIQRDTHGIYIYQSGHVLTIHRMKWVE